MDDDLDGLYEWSITYAYHLGSGGYIRVVDYDQDGSGDGVIDHRILEKFIKI